MKKILLPTIFSIAALSTTAQSKISVDGQAFIQQYQQQRLEMLSTNSTLPDEPVVGTIALLAEGYTADDIAAAGYEVKSDFGISVAVELPLSQVEAFAALDAVQSVTFGGKQNLRMDLARKACGVDDVHKGIDIDGTVHSYTGKGVLLGMMDTGLEPNHLNFFNYDEDGNKGSTRIKRLWVYPSSYITQKRTYTDSTVGSCTYDSRTASHATHVAGIMTGAYKGNGTFRYTSSPYSSTYTQKTNQPIPYYGIAYDADLAFSVGQLYENVILDGVQQIVNYAKTVDKTPVINLSLGNNIGPHDGTDSFSQTLNELSKDAIICVASGNEGDVDMSIEQDLTEDNLSFKSFLTPAEEYYDTPAIDGVIDIWSSDDQPITVTLTTYSATIKRSYTILTASGTTLSSKQGLSAGAASVVRGVDKNSGRYFVRITPSTPLQLANGYYLALNVTGNAGQRINVYYGSMGNFTDKNIDGYISGDASHSFNPMCVGDNIISVGSFSSRVTFGIFGNNQYPVYLQDDDAGAISSFSSWGTDINGNTYPTVLAPGATVISSFNSYYINYVEPSDYMTGQATNGNITDYWGYGNGTSMSTPFAVGVIGLWMEADPTLTAADVKEIIANSSKTDTYTARNPIAAGYGKIDAAAGLRYMFSRNAAIGTVKDDNDPSRLIVTPVSGGYDITLGGEADFTVALYDLQGRNVASCQGSDCNATLRTEGLAPGVYVMDVTGANTRQTRKIAVK